MTKTAKLHTIAEALDYDPETGTLENGPVTAETIHNLDEEYDWGTETHGDRLIARLEAAGLTDIVVARDYEKVWEIADLVAMGR